MNKQSKKGHLSQITHHLLFTHAADFMQLVYFDKHLGHRLQSGHRKKGHVTVETSLMLVPFHDSRCVNMPIWIVLPFQVINIFFQRKGTGNKNVKKGYMVDII